MGDVDEQQDTVDEKMWGDEEDDEEEQEEKKDEKEEKGPGAEAKTESELVAKDDNEGLCLGYKCFYFIVQPSWVSYRAHKSHSRSPLQS